MSAILVLLGASLSIAIGFLLVFLISAKHGQFDDVHTPSVRMLHDDPKPQEKTTNSENISEV